MRLPINRFAPLAAVVLLTGCLFGGGGGGRAESTSAGNVLIGNGPASDYPVVIGAPFTVDGVSYKPLDTMNYDQVGYASLGQAGGNAVSGANKVLPLPSYVEVTSLDSGKTILVRLERRGPMSNDRLVELSPGAAAQLGVSGHPRAPVRVRRVNPPEVERAALRSGQNAPYRMETPKSLLAVLVRKLNPSAPVALSGPAPAPTPSPTASARPRPVPARAVPPKATPTPRATPTPVTAPAPAPTPAAASGSIIVQVGAFSTQASASASAAKVGGRVSAAGRLFRVRMGPFTSQAQAQAALAKARSAGYSEARIQHAY